MTPVSKPLNEEKSRRLRPLRIVLAVLIAVLIVLILEKLPTSVKDRPEKIADTSTSAPRREAPENAKYYYLNGFLEKLEETMEARARELGVPEEEFKNISEYLSKEEITVLEAKATLAANLESVYVEVDDEGLEKLKVIFGLGDDYDFGMYQDLSAQPFEYNILSELLEDYNKAVNKVEDYDEPLE